MSAWKNRWTAPGCLAVGYFIAKWCFAPLLSWAVAQDNPAIFDVLNVLSGTEGRQDYWVYWGALQERWWGPLLQVLAVLFLMAFCRAFGWGLSRARFFVLVLTFFVVSKFEVLFFPAYGEENAAHMAEAYWLVLNNFDLPGLARQPDFSTGGPKVYLYSIVPYFLALLMKVTPSAQVFLAAVHLSVFAMSAWIIACTRGILRRVFDDRTASLGAILVLSLPLYQSMTELINLEMPLLFFSVTALAMLGERRMTGAGLAAVLAASVKATGAIVCLTYFAVCVVMFFSSPVKRAALRVLAGGAVVALIGFAPKLFRGLVYSVEPTNTTVNFLAGWAPLSSCWWLIAASLVCLAGAVVILIRARRVGQGQEDRTAVKFFTLTVMGVFIVCWFLAYLNLSVMGPRYKLLLAPALVCVGMLILAEMFRSGTVLAILRAGVVLAAVGSYGLYHPNKIETTSYSYNELERSLEYRNDHMLHILLARRVEEGFPGETVVAPFPIAQMLAIPQFGFVRQPMDTVIYELDCFYGGIRRFPGLTALDGPRTIWVGIKNSIVPDGVPYPIAPRDEVVEVLQVGNKKATLFRGGYAVEAVYQGVISRSSQQRR